MPLYYGTATATTQGDLAQLPAASVLFSPANPTATSSATLVMMGLGSTCTYTPTGSGKVLVTVAATATTATAATTQTVGLRYGVLAGAATTVAAGSNGAAAINTIAAWAQPSAGVLDVASTTGWAATGTLWAATNGQAAQISYTSITGGGTPSFNGCAYVAGTGSATIATGNAVTAYPPNGAAVGGTTAGTDKLIRGSTINTGNAVALAVRLSLTAGTTYWFDLAASTGNASDAASVSVIDMTIAELLS